MNHHLQHLTLGHRFCLHPSCTDKNHKEYSLSNWPQSLTSGLPVPKTKPSEMFNGVIFDNCNFVLTLILSGFSHLPLA